MKTTKIVYWILTVLFAGFMIWSGIPGLKPSEESVQFMRDYLGYPNYFTQFISVAKIAGGVVLLIPGLKTIKEWAYAGLFFDLVGAIYSIVVVAGKFEAGTLFIVLPLIVGGASYYFWKKLQATS